MDNFKYSIPTEIYFGKGSIEGVGEEVCKFSKKVLLVFGSDRIKRSGLFDKISELLKLSGIELFELGGVKPNPRVDGVREGIGICRENSIGFILAIGGGSVIDCAKAIAAGVQYQGDVWDFFVKKAVITSALPIGAVLTLAATGSEMNGNSVITNLETQQKLAVGNPLLRPKFSVLDPEYTYSVPPEQTAAGTVDIMSHIFEQYFSPTPDTYLQDRLAEALLKTCIEFGPFAMKNRNDYNARANLLWAGTLALNGIIGLGKNGDWATHGIEHAVSAVSDMTHGVGLAILTPAWMKTVLDNKNVEKFVNLARNVWGVGDDGDDMIIAQKGIDETSKFFASLGMPLKLSEAGIEKRLLPVIADKATEFGTQGSFKVLNRDAVLKLLELAF
jgi:hypothetical protein